MIDRSEIREVLLQWQRGDISERDVHEQMEALWERREWPELPDIDDESIAIQAVMKLDGLNVEWITRDDIPAFLDFLGTALGRAPEGWAQWRRYWDSVDMTQRQEQLRDNTYYSRVPIS